MSKMPEYQRKLGGFTGRCRVNIEAFLVLANADKLSEILIFFLISNGTQTSSTALLSLACRKAETDSSAWQAD
jgi:hypothetical protein